MKRQIDWQTRRKVKLQKKDAALLGVVAVILCIGLLAGFSPELSLRDRILSLVQLPKKAFSYVLDRHQEAEKEKAETEEAQPTEDLSRQEAPVPSQPLPEQTSPPQEEKTETPMDVFTEEDPVDLSRPAEPSRPDEEEESRDPEEEETQDPEEQEPEKPIGERPPVNQLPDHQLE